MKTNTQTAVNLNHLAHAAVASLPHPGAAIVDFRPVTAMDDRIAKRPASQQPELRQNNPNPGNALPAVAGGASGATSADLHFPQFPAIASRRDAPLPFGPRLLEHSDLVAKGNLMSSEPDAKFTGAAKGGHKYELLFQHKPLLRDTGIND
jgi:hypothetical protein